MKSFDDFETLSSDEYESEQLPKNYKFRSLAYAILDEKGQVVEHEAKDYQLQITIIMKIDNVLG